MNRLVAQLGDDIKRDIKILQLTRNKSLERLLEFVETRIEGNVLLFIENKILKRTNYHEKTECAEKLKSMVGSSLTKVYSLSHNPLRQYGDFITHKLEVIPCKLCL